MRTLPRVALGAVQPQADYRPLLWGLLQCLEEAGVQTQCFCSQSLFPAVDGATSITGRSYRHLDAQLMSPEICREVLLHGAHGADLSIIETGQQGGQASQERLIDWLELPRVVVLDVEHNDPCQVPPRPANVDGIFLTGASDHETFSQQRLRWETLWNAPVLGGLIGGAHIRAIVDHLPPGSRPSKELVRALGKSIVWTSKIARLLNLAGPAPQGEATQHLFRPSQAMNKLKVAVAFDDAFHTYFADTLDLLELNGAELRDFSPIADPDLPADTDVVYLGCGHVERFADALAANPCMIAALRRHARDGGRIYAEGGGAAYLCNQVEFDSGECIQMCGVIPAVARCLPVPRPAEFAEISLTNDCWLGRFGDRLRGYRNGRWVMEPMGPHWTLGGNLAARSLATHSEMLGRDHVIASQVHLNLVAQPHLLSSFAASASATIR